MLNYRRFTFAASAASLSAALLAGAAGAQVRLVAANGDAAAAPAAPANAAEGGGGADGSDVALAGEVVVTARHQVERAQDVPVALSVVSGSNLERTGTFTIADLQQQTPSLTAYNSNPRNSSTAIREPGPRSGARKRSNMSP